MAKPEKERQWCGMIKSPPPALQFDKFACAGGPGNSTPLLFLVWFSLFFCPRRDFFSLRTSVREGHPVCHNLDTATLPRVSGDGSPQEKKKKNRVPDHVGIVDNE